MSSRELFRLRSYQRKLREARQAGCKRFVCLWHRRTGKDRNALFFALEEMLKRTGVYFHIYPSLNQGRRDMWQSIVHQRYDGVEQAIKMVSMFPPELIVRKDETDMLLELANGSIYQVMGADNDDAVARLRGPNPVGLIFSEYAHGDKMKDAWDTLSPVLAENNGWALFVYTPNGPNHGEELAKYARGNPSWFYQELTVNDTRRDAVGEDGTPVITQDEINELRKQGQREEFIQQEYYCKFTGFLHSTIYGDLMMQAEKDGRILRIPYTVNTPVGVCMDLGFSDATAVWFYQLQLNSVLFIDYWEATQKSISDVARVMREEKPYQYGRVVLPWDGRAAADYLESMRFKNVHVCARGESRQAEVEQVRREFSRFYFESARCAEGITALRNYKRKYDEAKQAFSEAHVHDRFVHGADALRTGVLGRFGPLEYASDDAPVKVIMDFDPRASVGGW